MDEFRASRPENPRMCKDTKTNAPVLILADNEDVTFRRVSRNISKAKEDSKGKKGSDARGDG